MVDFNRFASPLYTKLSDKFLVREYVKETIGKEYLINLIWHGADPRNIPFVDLPPKCIAKTNHGSGNNIILDSSKNPEDVVAALRDMLGRNYYWECREFQYYNIMPIALIEDFIDDGEVNGPLDYRFWCFQGKPEIIQVDNNAHDINPFYDLEWRKLDLRYRNDCRDVVVQQPENFDEMLRVATKLATGIDFVRVDLYNVKGEIYFGELTFTPVAGRLKFQPEIWDRKLGQKWIVAK